MTEFTASNKARLTIDDYGSFQTIHIRTVDNQVLLAGVHVTALREFFQAERDEALGRWRWPENPDYVVYLSHRDAPVVTVVNELGGRSASITRNGVADRPNGELFFEAARAYFDAHPEPKPWHDAKPGEVWAAVLTGMAVEVALRVEGSHTGPRFRRIAAANDYALDSNRIHTARRIWPEVTS